MSARAGLVVAAGLALGCAPPPLGFVALAPEGETLPTNGTLMIETAGEARVEGERVVDEGPPETLVPLITRCAGARCFTPVPVGPLPGGAALAVALRVDEELLELAFEVELTADRRSPAAAQISGDLDEARVRVFDEDLIVVLVEDARTGLPVAGQLAPSPGVELRLPLEEVDGLRCVFTLAMDRGGNLGTGEEHCFE